ncbi:uncharacterized protein LOC123562990 [Mercenaria mercenaria]|uniref:uncharacterized protein LOC123562990 n=1 Tax=Mercenaria mercenaria TaxID=6596 RepID=UPI00234F29B5|nr:uncharacterized protein LOC123562990 [Mercenaria mercenaria]
MDTPRRGLIRATENAIKEYIKEGCVENLPMIRQLEDVAYQIWVESNTSFLNESVVTVEDEDGWMWDEDYLYQSFSVNADGNLTDVADDNSSICSSIKPCDETDCSLGYLASCEDDGHAHMDTFESESWEMPENNFIKDSSEMCAKFRIDCSVSDSERNGFNDQEGDCIFLSKDNGNFEIKMYGTEHVVVDKVNETLINDEALRESNEHENTDIHITETVNKNEDEWVIVNEDWSESVPNNDWFIVSVNETNQSKLESPRLMKSASVDILPKQLETSKNELEDNEKNKSGVFDLNDWAVLSMKITERRDPVEAQTIKQTIGSELSCEHEFSHEAKTTAKHDSRLDLIRETFGFETPVSCGISDVNRCPLCKNSKDNYKCAIFCLLMR